MLVGEVVNEEHGGGGNSCWPFLDFDAREVRHTHHGVFHAVGLQAGLVFLLVDAVMPVEFASAGDETKRERAQLLVRHDQEIATATCWIQQSDPGKPVVQFGEFCLVVPGVFEFAFQVVEE